LRTLIIADTFLNSSADIKNLFGCAFDPEAYSKVLNIATREYIQGRREFPIPPSGDLYSDNVKALALKLIRAAGLDLSMLPVLLPVLMRMLTDNTSAALASKFLTEFDFANCRAIGLPPSWLE